MKRLYDNLERKSSDDPKSPVSVQVNLYRRVTSFWLDGLWSQRPEPVPEEMASAFEKATRWRSIKGYGVVVAEPGRPFRSVDPGNWWPVYDRLDGDRVIGDLIFWRFLASSVYQPDELNLPDRVQVNWIPRGSGLRRAWERVYQLEAGQTLGTLLSERQYRTRGGVAAFGDGISDYRDLQSVVREFEHRLGRVKRVLDRTSDPFLQGPTEALDSSARFPWPSKGGYLPVDTEGQRYAYVEPRGEQEAQFRALEVLLSQFHIISSIPSTALGLEGATNSLFNSESGVSRERQLFAALQRLRRLRREVAAALIAASEYAGAPFAVVDWPDSPFSEWSEIATTVVPLVEKGILTVPEARERIGIGR